MRFEYNKLGALTSVVEEGQRYNYTYDDAGRLTEEENAVTGLKTLYAYYPSGLLKNLNHTIKEDLFKSLAYTYDLRGNQVQKDEMGEITTYHYDPLGRLKTAELPNGILQDYGYDDFSNRTQLVEVDGNSIKETNYLYDRNNRLILSEMALGNEGKQQRYVYDNEGNLITKEECFTMDGALMADKTSTFGYNGYNQLDFLEDPNGQLFTYGYDGNGLRTSKSTNDQVINFINEGGNIILEANQDMTITAKNVRGLGLIYRETEKGYYGYVHNERGDTLALTDELGNIIKDYQYDPFGNDLNPNLQGFGDNGTGEIWSLALFSWAIFAF